jgi:hypothetical protein
MPGHGRWPGTTMELLYYDRDGQPISEEQWQRFGHQSGYGRVDYTDATRHGRHLIVVTCWLGAAGGHQLGPPLIFHTLAELRLPAAAGASYRRSWSWPTLQAARDGHQAVTSWLTGVAAWLAGTTDQPPALPPALITGQRQPGPADPLRQVLQGW